ncbi:type II toxin-antitoxin system HicB family antitoxin [Methylophilus sp. 3sh_L]|uniref:type II toxin-antitoxin system HicB family antitoxin n=1 Tax=Methylophilus sp. 3sh_L TaxID=3377114 RepID=UPI00398E7377
MLFPIAIHKEPNSSYGVTVPDVPGCFSFGDTVDEALTNAKEAITGHIETLLELGESVDIKVSEIESLKTQPAFSDAAWGFVDVDLTQLDAKPERVNISLPKFVLNRIDHYVAANHETRSGFLARAALSVLAHEK